MYVERSDASSTGGSTVDDYLARCVALVAERGTGSASVVRNAVGDLLTPAGYSDTCVDVHPATGQVVAGRRFSGELWSPVPAVDYVVEHWGMAKATEPDRFGGLEYGSTHWLHAGRYGGPSALLAAGPTTPVWDAALVRISPDGGRIVFVEFRAQRQVWMWTHDVRTGARGPLIALPEPVLLGDLSISGDGDWALVGVAPVFLVHLESAAVTQLPQVRTACWYTVAGASTVLAARGAADGPTEIGVLDLATDDWTRMCQVRNRIDSLDASAQGDIAAVVNTPGQDGWLPHVAVVDVRDGSTTPVAALRFRAGPWRRTSQPRWLDRQPATADRVALSPTIASGLRQIPLEPTGADVQHYG
jgi:hypothetical protein